MESKCAVVFFDEIDALGRSRMDDDDGKVSQAGGDNSSRRLLAELLIQMTSLANDNGEADSESEAEGEECGDDCDDDNLSFGAGSFGRNGKVTPNMVTQPGQSTNHDNTKRALPRVIVVAATNRPGGECAADKSFVRENFAFLILCRMLYQIDRLRSSTTATIRRACLGGFASEER